MRSSEHGWRCASMHDPAGRRGIWFRESPGVVELCAGREGDDWYARIAVGDTVSREQVASLLDCVAVGAWMLSEQEEGSTGR